MSCLSAPIADEEADDGSSSPATTSCCVAKPDKQDSQLFVISGDRSDTPAAVAGKGLRLRFQVPPHQLSFARGLDFDAGSYSADLILRAWYGVAGSEWSMNQKKGRTITELVKQLAKTAQTVRVGDKDFIEKKDRLDAGERVLIVEVAPDDPEVQFSFSYKPLGLFFAQGWDGDDEIALSKPQPGGYADNIGVESGMVLLAVNDRSVRGLEFQEAIALVNGGVQPLPFQIDAPLAVRTGPPLVLHIVAPTDNQECAGEYHLEKGLQPNGLPLWRKVGTKHERWLYNGLNGRWIIGSYEAKRRNFACNKGLLASQGQHGGKMPDKAAWVRWNGNEFEDDVEITASRRPPVLESSV